MVNDKCSEVLAWKSTDMTTEDQSSAQITNTNQRTGTAYDLQNVEDGQAELDGLRVQNVEDVPKRAGRSLATRVGKAHI